MRTFEAVLQRVRFSAACKGGARAAMVVAVTLACACRGPSPPPASWAVAEAPNYRRVDEGFATANTITLAAISKLAAVGFKTIVDLRAPVESGVAEEAAAAERAGIRYVNVPVTLATLATRQVRAVAAVLDNPANRPVLLHCSSGNRVGAVLALYREKIQGVDAATSYAEGRASGLQLPAAVAAMERVRRVMPPAP